MGILSILCFLPEALNQYDACGRSPGLLSCYLPILTVSSGQWLEECTFYPPKADKRTYSCGHSPRFKRGSLLIPTGVGNQMRCKSKFLFYTKNKILVTQEAEQNLLRDFSISKRLNTCSFFKLWIKEGLAFYS